MGHSNCGAVTSAIDALQSKTMVTPGLNSVIQPIQQAVATFKGYGNSHLDEAVSANVRNSVAVLKSTSSLLGDFIRAEGLLIAGGQYRLESGVVDFFND
jgi:carbonic anhydrase